MPEDYKKPDPFKPAQPQIPGVPEARRKTEPAARAKAAAARPRSLLLGLAGGGAAVALAIGFAIWWTHGAPHAAPAGRAQSPATSAVSAAAASLPVGPGEIATTNELARPWSAKEFLFRKPSGEEIPAMVVRLPGDAYWAFSLREPYGNCRLEYVTDLNQLASDYGFAAKHPMVADPCTHAVYDLAKYGAGPNGLVRGAMVSGSGLRPPLAIEVRVSGTSVVAVRSE